MNDVIGICPVCKSEMIVTRLSCEECGTELTNQFKLSRYAFLTQEERVFLETFLLSEGNLKTVQNKLALSYPAAKKQLQKILTTLDLKKEDNMEQNFIAENIQTNPESKRASDIIQHLLYQNGGKATVSSQRGNNYIIRLSNDGKRMFSDALPSVGFELRVFDVIVQLLKEQGGRALKGNGRNNRLGEGNCGFDTVVGRIGRDYSGKKQGEWVLDPVMVMNAVLCWANICCFADGGYMELSPEYLSFTEQP